MTRDMEMYFEKPTSKFLFIQSMLGHVVGFLANTQSSIKFTNEETSDHLFSNLKSLEHLRSLECIIGDKHVYDDDDDYYYDEEYNDDGYSSFNRDNDSSNKFVFDGEKFGRLFGSQLFNLTITTWREESHVLSNFHDGLSQLSRLKSLKLHLNFSSFKSGFLSFFHMHFSL